MTVLLDKSFILPIIRLKSVMSTDFYNHSKMESFLDAIINRQIVLQFYLQSYF